jgi:hypothetical protein
MVRSASANAFTLILLRPCTVCFNRSQLEMSTAISNAPVPDTRRSILNDVFDAYSAAETTDHIMSTLPSLANPQQNLQQQLPALWVGASGARKTGVLAHSEFDNFGARNFRSEITTLCRCVMLTL